MSRASERLELVRAVATFFRSIVQEEDQSRQDILNRFLPRILTAAPSSSSSSVSTAASSRSGEEGATSSPTRTQQQQQQQSPPQSEHKDSPDRSAFLDEGSSQTDPPSISAAGEKTTMTVVVPPHGARRRSTVKMSDEALIDLSIPTHHQPMHRRPTDSAAAIDAHSLSAFLAQSQLSTGAASAMDASQSVMSSDPADGEAGKPSVVFEVMPPKDPLASSASFMVDRTKPAASSSRQQQETDEHRKDDPFDSSVLSLSDGGRRRLSNDVAPQTTTSASLSEKKTGLAALPDALRIGLTISQSLEHDNRYDIIHEESDCFKQILQEHRESFFHLTKSLREGQLCDRLQMERCLTLRLVQLVVRWERERQYMDSLELARRAWHHKREGARLHLAALEAEERDMVVTRDELQRSQWQRLERNTRLEILQREQELYNEEDDDGMDLEGEGSLGALVHVLS